MYLEEGIIELVCLSTDLSMEHCDAIRAKMGVTAGIVELFFGLLKLKMEFVILYSVINNPI